MNKDKEVRIKIVTPGRYAYNVNFLKIDKDKFDDIKNINMTDDLAGKKIVIIPNEVSITALRRKFKFLSKVNIKEYFYDYKYFTSTVDKDSVIVASPDDFDLDINNMGTLYKLKNKKCYTYDESNQDIDPNNVIYGYETTEADYELLRILDYMRENNISIFDVRNLDYGKNIMNEEAAIKIRKLLNGDQESFELGIKILLNYSVKNNIDILNILFSCINVNHSSKDFKFFKYLYRTFLKNGEEIGNDFRDLLTNFVKNKKYNRLVSIIVRENLYDTPDFILDVK